VFLPPRIIVIDDNPKHLQGLVDGLHRYGTSCLPIHFTGDLDGISSCPALRLIFADLHLNDSGAGTEHQKHFATIGGLIETALAPTGPYVLILWTQFADQAEELRKFLESRLQDVSKPLAVVALDKMVHLRDTGAVKNPAALVKAIDLIIRGQPQLAALLRWEERVLGATAETAGAILGLTDPVATGTARAKELGRIFARLATEAVGEKHVEEDRFGAVNEALLPILADRIAALHSTTADQSIWNQAFDTDDAKAAIALEEAARLNRMLHVDETSKTKASDRGSVVVLPVAKRGDAFTRLFGIDEATAAGKQFGCKDFDPNSEQFRWMLVQSQAACDFAQRQPGPVPFMLALEIPCASAASGRLPGALWQSPALHLRDMPRYLMVNYRFEFLSPPKATSKIKAAYRIRESLLNALLTQAHAYGARPGYIFFRKQAAKTGK
jgi:hypothetical protein